MPTIAHPPIDRSPNNLHRKSRPIKRDWASGNEAKFLSYREAWTRIKLATKQGFFLEAVTIEESIVSDRMLSFLEKSCGVVIGGHSLSNTSKEWLKHAKKLVGEESDEAKLADELFSRLNAWRDHRNNVVHGIVKSKVPRLEDHIDNFLTGAASAALEGEKVARAIDRWVSKNGLVRTIL
jgi:hypothetical protein